MMVIMIVIAAAVMTIMVTIPINKIRTKIYTHKECTRDKPVDYTATRGGVNKWQ